MAGKLYSELNYVFKLFAGLTTGKICILGSGPINAVSWQLRTNWLPADGHQHVSK